MCVRCWTALCKPCGGCGSEVYYNEWYNDPPRCCDPCDHCGNWNGCGGCGCDGGYGGGGCGCGGYGYSAPYGHPYSGYASNGRPGSANMNYAMSPSSKRTMVAKQGVSKQGMSKQGMTGSTYAAATTIPTPKHVGPAMQSPSNTNYSGQYAQQSNQPAKYRTARKPQQQQPNTQQMMYQQ